jgi:predicted AAA+ superfamily ATPase
MTAYAQATRERIITDPAAWGRWVENAVGMHLLNASRQQGFGLWYWRDGNYEIDFIAKRGNQLVAIEVKSGNRIKNSGLARFEKQFGSFKKYLVGADGLAWQEFLKIDPQLLFDA